MAEILSECKKTLQLWSKETALFAKCRDLEEALEGFGRDEVIWYQTVQMGHDVDRGYIEADVKLCNGDTGPWLEMVIFQDGSEIACSEVNDVGFGPLCASYDGEEFEIDVIAMPEGRCLSCGCDLHSGACPEGCVNT